MYQESELTDFFLLLLFLYIQFQCLVESIIQEIQLNEFQWLCCIICRKQCVIVPD